MRSRLSRIAGVLLLVMGLSIIGVSAYVYETATQTISQTVQEIATLTVSNSALGDIEEGQTLYYTTSNQSDLDDIISLTTTKANVYLHLDSDLDTLTTYYTTYQIVVKFDTVPGSSSHSQGDTACTLTIGSPDTSTGIDLDVAGSWTFDFEITTTAKSVSSDQATQVTITVTAESTQS